MEKTDLQFEGFQSAQTILDQYDPISDEWKFRKDSEFWCAVYEAHKNGFRGEGKTIAIIDSAFDLNIPKVSNSSGGKIELKARSGKNHAHGTVVALLIAEIAPQAKLKLYEVSRRFKPDENLIVKSLKLAGNSDADIVNLSIGRPIKKLGSDDTIKPGDNHCILCNSAANTAKCGKIVVVSVGNKEGDVFCPASNPTIIGVGFQSENRSILNTEEGGLTEKVLWDKPSYSQAFNSDYTIIQPEGVLGSSFAAPLISGALALCSDSGNIVQLFKALQTGGIAEAFHFSLNNRSSDKDVDFVKTYYLNALNSLPHKHNNISGPPCVECSVFVQGLYVNAGLFFLNYGDYELSEKLLRVGRWLAPWSPHAAANLATVIRIKGKIILDNSKDFKLAKKLFLESRKEYIHALELRPNSEVYKSGLKIVDEFLSYFSKA